MTELTLQGVDFPEGYVAVIDKPYEWTSADVVRKIKFQLRKCGYPKIKIGFSIPALRSSTASSIVAVANPHK